MWHIVVVVVVLCCSITSSLGHVAQVERSRFAFRQLMNWYLPSSGRWIGHLSYPPDWCRANAVESIANYYLYNKEILSDDEKNYIWGILQETQKAQGTKFYQDAEYFDDILWWSLAYTRAYEVGLQRNEILAANEFLQVAQGINDVVAKDSWEGSVCNGGAYWSRTSKYKNAITNELYIVSSSRLAKLTADSKFTERATLGLNWLLNSGMLQKDSSLIVDGLDSSCNPTGGVYTYNQGVILGGISEYTKLFPSNSSLVETGEQIAKAVSVRLTDASTGVLTEVSCGDGALFKGIYTRYLRYFIEMSSPSSSPSFEDFLLTQSESVWNKDRDLANGYFGKSWLGLYDYNYHNLQVSALELFDAASSKSVQSEDKNLPICGEHGWPTGENSCACFSRFTGSRCDKEVASWSSYYSSNSPRVTFTNGLRGTLLCALSPTTQTPDKQSVVSCTSDGTMDLSYFTVESVNSQTVRLRTLTGAYLSVQDDPFVIARKIDATTDINTVKDIQFVATTVSPISNDDKFGLSNPLAFEYVSFRSVMNNKVLSVSGNRGAVEFVDDSSTSFNAAATLFQTNLEQICH
jgi:predicted alpha-1,6-mannanase (GH76 family)